MAFCCPVPTEKEVGNVHGGGHQDGVERSIIHWRRTDLEGLERLELLVGKELVSASSTVICLEAGGFRLDHHWILTPEWKALSVAVDCWNPQGRKRLLLERSAHGWLVDGKPRPDLDGADEPDLSVTPFCNSLPARRVPAHVGCTLQLDTAFIDGSTLSVARSKQLYRRTGPGRFRYVDLGLSHGFEADLHFGNDGLVERYEHLFERVSPPA